MRGSVRCRSGLTNLRDTTAAILVEPLVPACTGSPAGNSLLENNEDLRELFSSVLPERVSVGWFVGGLVVDWSGWNESAG